MQWLTNEVISNGVITGEKDRKWEVRGGRCPVCLQTFNNLKPRLFLVCILLVVSKID